MNYYSFLMIIYIYTLIILITNPILLTLSILNPIDFLALQAIHKSLTDLPGSNYFSSWDFTSNPCNFAGIYCINDKVTALNLGDPRAGSPGLTGRLNPSIGKLSGLTELTIVPGRVYGNLPATLGQLKELRFLAISRNYISSEIPAGLGQLHALRTLDLSFNQLTGNIPFSIGKLPVLSNVMLTRNRLTGPVPVFISRTLTRLDLSRNYLSGSLIPYSLPPSLQYLSFAQNRLTGPVNRVLYRLNRLNHLDLSTNRFTGRVPGNLFSFPISNLQLQRNQFSGPVQPVGPVTIANVDLSFNVLSSTISPFFATVENLYLNNNRFTGEVPGSFVDRLLGASMHILYLQHNYLTGIAINPTADIPSSSSLCLQYNCMVLPVQAACPLKAGKDKSRPTQQCRNWKG